MLPATWMTIIAMCAEMKTTAGKAIRNGGKHSTRELIVSA